MTEAAGSSADERALLARAAALAADHLDTLVDRPVAAVVTPEAMLAAVDGPVPEGPRPPESVLESLAALAEPGLTAMGSGRFFGFVIGGSYPAALAADVLVSAWEQNSGLWAATPATAALEHQAGRWVLDLLGLPGQASVGFTTGGCMANFTGLAAGRHAVLAREGWDVEESGLQGAPRVRVIASQERHATIDVAVHLLGLGSGTVEALETDGQSRIRVADLERALAAGSGPALVSLAAGNVNTGAFDPLAEAIEVAHSYGAWVHVDGAFGLWAGASESLRPLVAGVEQADSWATDAHKWLNVPYDCGISIVRDQAALRAAMGVRAAYLVQGGGLPDPMDLVPEFSRRARGVPVWAALSALGRTGVAELIERCCAHARRFADGFAAMEGAEVLNDVVLNQVLVRFDEDDAVTRAVVAAVQDGGEAYPSGTTWKGLAGMRVSVSNWRTTEADVDRTLAAVQRALTAAR
jgi:glutamate/tyrosine decarboxylase-like PLP-dependent enzyme